MAGQVSWDAVFAQATVAAFLLLAGLEIGWRAGNARPFRATARVAFFGASYLTILLIAASALWVLEPYAAARLKALEVLEFEIPEGLAALLFFLAAAQLRRPRGWSRAMPLFERMRAARHARARPGRLPALRRRAWLEGVGWFVCMAAFSALWLYGADLWAGAHAGGDLVRAVRRETALGWAVVFVRRLVPLMLAPFAEEIAYRGYIQPRVALLLERVAPAKWAAVGSVALVSAAWALGHSEMIEPAWVKWGQIAGIGVALGVARMRLGLEACILLHLGFNLLGVCIPLHSL